MKLTQDQMRARFHENRAERAAITDKAAPLRAEREQLLASVEPRIREIETQLKAIEAPAYELDNEASALARALKGKTGKVAR